MIDSDCAALSDFSAACATGERGSVGGRLGPLPYRQKRASALQPARGAPGRWIPSIAVDTRCLSAAGRFAKHTDFEQSVQNAVAQAGQRWRRRNGTRCVTAEVNESEVAALVARSYLPEADRNALVAIKAAIEGVISDIAFELRQVTTAGSGPRV